MRRRASGVQRNNLAGRCTSRLLSTAGGVGGGARGNAAASESGLLAHRPASHLSPCCLPAAPAQDGNNFSGPIPSSWTLLSTLEHIFVRPGNELLCAPVNTEFPFRCCCCCPAASGGAACVSNGTLSRWLLLLLPLLLLLLLLHLFSWLFNSSAAAAAATAAGTAAVAAAASCHDSYPPV